jgi:hypothetical protein
MRRIRIDPLEFPLQNGESWWVVHPNIKTAEFRIPAGAITVCTEDLLVFKKGIVYSVISADYHNGWVTVSSEDALYDMPQYLFSRKFDAEAFVIGVMTPEEREKAKPFDYKPTLPKRPSPPDIEHFEG